MEKVAGRLSSPLGNTILLWVSVGDGKNPLGPDSLRLLGRAGLYNRSVIGQRISE